MRVVWAAAACEPGPRSGPKPRRVLSVTMKLARVEQEAHLALCWREICSTHFRFSFSPPYHLSAPLYEL